MLSSSGGADAEGRPVITPLSVLRCVDDANGIEFQTLAVDTVRITVNALWCAHWTNVALPVSRLFSHVPVAPALIRHWLHQPPPTSDQQKQQLGGLVFPVNHMCTTSKVPRLHIEKSKVVVDAAAGGTCGTTTTTLLPPANEEEVLRVDLDLQVFRRDLSTTTTTTIDNDEKDEDLRLLPPFDPALGWRAESYERWRYMYATLPPMIEEEELAIIRARRRGGSGGGGGGRASSSFPPPPPSHAAALFRRMMRAHSDDAAIIFGQMWWSFGLRDLLVGEDEESLHVFMRRVLMGMFSAYYSSGVYQTQQEEGQPAALLLPAAAVLPPCFDAVTVDPAQRLCAACLVTMLGSGRMLRCPCHKVYYCSKACQLANWGVHRVLCPVAAARSSSSSSSSGATAGASSGSV